MKDPLACSSPYAHAGSKTSNVMLLVCLALLPATLFGLYLFGWPAVNLFVITCLSALIFECLSLVWMKQPWQRVFDGSALLTGWLIAITLPPWAPWWIGAVGAGFAIVVGKQLYGGLGQNIFNPAMLARTALLITFPVQMTVWVAPAPFGSEMAPTFLQALNITFANGAIPDGLTGATYLGTFKTALSQNIPLDTLVASEYNVMSAAFGWTSGSMAEGSELLVLLGGLLLLKWRLISWEIPVSMILTVGLFALVFSQVNGAVYADPIVHLTSGGLMLGAFFIATDPVTSPISRFGKLIFGASCGLVIFIIRTWGGFPEAVAFAVLFINGFTPLIDRYIRPRVYGRLANGEPSPLPTQTELSRKSGDRS